MKNLSPLTVVLLLIVSASTAALDDPPGAPVTGSSRRQPAESRPPEPVNIRPPLENKLKTLCGGIECIDREFEQYSRLSPDKSRLARGDTSTVIADNLINTRNKLAVILGERGSGKTVTLAKIENALRTKTAGWSIITVDLAISNGLDAPSADWNPEGVLFANLDETQWTQVKDLLKSDAAKVVFLVDNVDKIHLDARVKLIHYLMVGNRDGAGVVISSTKRLGWTPSISPTDTVIEIPQLSASEMEVFLTRHWDREFGLSNSYKHGDYAKAVAKVLEESSLPRSFNTAKQLVQLLSDGDAVIFGDKQNFLTVKDYVKGKVSNAFAVVEMLETMKVNKFRLFEKFTAPLIHSESAADYYGLNALKTIQSNEINEAVEAAQYRKHEGGIDLIRANIDELPEFTHPEYENFLAARYIIEQVKGDTNLLQNSVRIILNDPEYFEIAEYFNSVLAESDMRLNFKPALRHIIKSDFLYTVLDNALSFGFDNVASAIFKSINNVPEIGKYFLNNVAKSKIKLKFDSNHRFGMLSISRERSSYERQEMLFRRGMEKTIEMLIRVETVQGAQRNQMWQTEKWVEYLKEFYLTQSRPSIKIYKMMKPYLQTNLPPEVANELVFKAVDHGGLRNKPIIQDLIFRGATPPTISVAGETLAHLALKNRNPSLLKYIYEDLKVPIVDKTATKSLLITALDSNPLPRYSQPQFWETMEYFVNHGDFKIPQPQSSIIGLLNTRPTTSDQASAAYSLLVGTDDQKFLDKKITKLKVSSGILETLSPDVRNYRRNTVLSRGLRLRMYKLRIDHTSLTEILLKYRGLDTLTPFEQIAYESCIVTALKFDTKKEKLSRKQQRRIRDNFIQNVGTLADYKFMENLLETRSILIENFDKKIYIDLINSLNNRLNSKVDIRNPSREASLRNGVSLTRAQLHPQIVGLTDSLRIILENLNNERKKFASRFSACGNLKRRRRSTTKCLITKSEYDEFVKLVEKDGKKILTIDTYDYLTKLHKLEFINRKKFGQYIELGKRLIEENGASLTGEYKNFFMERVKPHVAEKQVVEGVQKNVEFSYPKISMDKPFSSLQDLFPAYNAAIKSPPRLDQVSSIVIPEEFMPNYKVLRSDELLNYNSKNNILREPPIFHYAPKLQPKINTPRRIFYFGKIG